MHGCNTSRPNICSVLNLHWLSPKMSSVYGIGVSTTHGSCHYKVAKYYKDVVCRTLRAVLDFLMTHTKFSNCSLGGKTLERLDCSFTRLKPGFISRVLVDLFLGEGRLVKDANYLKLKKPVQNAVHTWGCCTYSCYLGLRIRWIFILWRRHLLSGYFWPNEEWQF